MLVISIREFRANQGKYLSMALEGQDIILKSRSKGSFRIIPLTEDDTLMSKEEYFANIDRSLQEIKEGKGFEMLPNESLSDFLKRTECTK